MKKRQFSVSSVLFFVAFIITLLPALVVGRAVVGIDLGSTNVRMGMLRSGVGSVEMVLSFESDRKTIAAVGYRDGQTLFSQTAMNMFPKFPKNIFCRLNMLLGKVFSSPSVSSYASTFTHHVTADPKRGTVLIEEPVQKKLVPIEQLSATFFAHLLEQAQKHAGFPVVDCVIAVPEYFGQWERQAVMDAAKIAGFNVLSLINGASSAAFFKITTGNDLTEKSNFIIFDSGAGGTSASLITFDPNKDVDGLQARFMEVKAVAADEGLGGDLIDDRIAAFLTQKFEAVNPGVKVTPGKALNKVLVEAAKIKKILNTNDHVSVNLDELIDEASLMIPRLQREEIDALLVDLADRFIAPIKQVLKDAGMPENDLSGINAILMIGGNFRHQFVQRALKAAFGQDKLSVTLDPDEAIVKGATLFAAKLHPAFRLRPVHFVDILPEGLSIEYSKLPGAKSGVDLFSLPWADDHKSIELFPARSPLAGRKSLTLKHHSSLLAELKSSSASGQVIARIAVDGFEQAVSSVASAQRTIIASKLRIPIQLSLSGQVVIEPAVAVIEYEEMVEASGNEAKSTSVATATSAESATTTEQSQSTEAVDETLEQPKESQPSKQLKKFTKTVPLSFNIQYRIPPMSDDAIKDARSMIDEAKAEEMKKVALATARNDLEQSVYHWQAEVSAEWFQSFSSKQEKSQMTKAVQKASNLLNDKKAAAGEDPTPYQRALQEISALEASVKTKQAEFEGRPAALAVLNAVFAQVQEFLAAQLAIPAEERAVTDAELNDLKAELVVTEKWSTDLNKKQSSLTKHDQPVLLVAEIEKKAGELRKFMAKLKAKKLKPKPVVEVKNEAKPSEAKAEEKEPVQDPTQEANAKEQSNANTQEQSNANTQEQFPQEPLHDPVQEQPQQKAEEIVHDEL